MRPYWNKKGRKKSVWFMAKRNTRTGIYIYRQQYSKR